MQTFAKFVVQYEWDRTLSSAYIQPTKLLLCNVCVCVWGGGVARPMKRLPLKLQRMQKDRSEEKRGKRNWLPFGRRRSRSGRRGRRSCARRGRENRSSGKRGEQRMTKIRTSTGTDPMKDEDRDRGVTLSHDLGAGTGAGDDPVHSKLKRRFSFTCMHAAYVFSMFCQGVQFLFPHLFFFSFRDGSFAKSLYLCKKINFKSPQKIMCS